MIKNCQLFHNYLVIDTGKVLFLFDIEEEYVLTKKIYEDFKKDENFKDNFLNSSNLIGDDGNLSDSVLEYIFKTKEELLMTHTEKEVNKILETMSNYGFVRSLGNIIIEDYSLNDKENKGIKIDFEKELEKLDIDYDISGTEKIVNFTNSVTFPDFDFS